jgi:hypothetical protein
VLVQAALIAAGAVALYAIGLLLTGSRALSVLALGLGLLAGEFAWFPHLYLSENVAFPAFAGFLACAVAWMGERGRWPVAAAAGGLLCLAALTRPSYLYLFYAVAAGLGALSLWPHRQDRNRDFLSFAAFLAAGTVVLMPWLVRNYLTFGDAALTEGYGAFTLSQRVAYNAMTGSEWFVAWVYWLPDFGDNLIKSLLPKEHYVRLGWTDPSSFYVTGKSRVFRDTLAAAGSKEAHLSYLVREHVIGQAPWHIAVSLPLSWRGIWAGGYLAIAGALLAPAFAGDMKSRGRLPELAALVLPLVFMAGLHGFVSVNIVRYNEAMIVLWAIIVAWAVVEARRRMIGWRSP